MLRSLIITLFLCCILTPCYSLDLLEVYQAGRQHDGQYQVEQLRFKALLLDEKIARARSLPQLSYHYRWMKNDYRSDQQGVHFPDSFEEQLLACGQSADQLACLVDGLSHVDVYKLRSKYTSQESNLTLSQVIFDPEVGAERAQGRALTLKAAAEMAAAEKQLILRSLSYYLQYLRAQQEQGLHSRLLADLQEQYISLEQQYRLGVASEEDWLDMQLALDEQQMAYRASQSQWDIAVRRLEQFTAQRIVAIAPISEKLEPSAFDLGKLEYWQHLAVEFNDNIKLAEAAEQIANYELRKHKVNRLPRITVAANYQDRELKGGHAFQPASTSTAYGVDVRLPLYHGGALYYGRRKAAYQQLEAQDKVQWQKQQLTRTVEDMWQVLREYESRFTSYKGRLTIWQDRVKQYEKAYQNGSKPFATLLQARQKELQSKVQLAELQRQFLLQWFEFKLLVGTLSLEDLKQLNVWLVYSDG